LTPRIGEDVAAAAVTTRHTGRLREGFGDGWQRGLGGETVDTKSATGKLILTIFAGFAQFEREMMLERQREGIAKAQAEGRYKGRPKSASLLASEARQMVAGGKTVLGIASASVYRTLEAA
jgi:DNA invertase Pin-like site-specific DNA recombinase